MIPWAGSAAAALTRPGLARAGGFPVLPLLLSAVLLAAVDVGHARGQSPPGGGAPARHAPTWAAELGFLGAGALLGGLTAGVAQELRGGSFRDGFARGTLGGAIAYGGRRISVERFDGAGLLGREVSAVGISVVRNASEGRPSLERVFFPFGPVHLYLDRSGETRVRAKLDAFSLWWTVTAAVQPELELDAGATLSAGAPVFRAPLRRVISAGDTLNGYAAGGVIILSGQPGPGQERTFPHERVHVLQYDFEFYAWSDPLEGWLARKSRLGAAIYRYVDLGPTAPLLLEALFRVAGIDEASQPQEVEAEFLERR